MAGSEPKQKAVDQTAVMAQGGGESDVGYTVVARRYRPKTFSELVGQENVAQALGTAIRTGRIGHAYLFTGARGVGKTSTARIFAKALNATGGPSAEPEMDSEIAKAIDAGEDMDVLEIDGASNRGIEEIRQLRANVNVRPSRSRYKIYIIDEVHMLTTAAFNALLKTLEEPPEHVKFIFCTTDPEKIPITVLSRCQRFDFPPVKKEAIQERLRLICQREGFEADDEALALIARRAAGSMRDSQSLLEQVLSFSEGRITVDSVHEMLGTADETSLWEIVECFIAHDAVGVLKSVEQAVGQGVEPGQFAEQLLGYLRDLMTRGVGAPVDLLRHIHSIAPEQLSQQVGRWGMQSLIAAMQILDESLVRMRHSMHGRTLLEMTLVQIAQLHRLESLLGLAGVLPTGAPAASGDSRASSAIPSAIEEQKKKLEPVENSASSSSGVGGVTDAASLSRPEAVSNSNPPPKQTESSRASSVASATASMAVPPPHVSVVASVPQPMVNEPSSGQVAASTTSIAKPIDIRNSRQLWQSVAERLQGLTADFAGLYVDATWGADEALVVSFEKRNQHAIDHFQRPDRKAIVDREIQSLTGKVFKLQFQAVADRVSNTPEVKSASDPTMIAQRNQRMRQIAEHPLVKALAENFGGEIVRIDPPAPPKIPFEQKG